MLMRARLIAAPSSPIADKKVALLSVPVYYGGRALAQALKRDTPQRCQGFGLRPFLSRAAGTDHFQEPSYGLASFCSPRSRHWDGVELQRRKEPLMPALPSDLSATEGSSILY